MRRWRFWMRLNPKRWVCGDFRTMVASLPSPSARRTCMVEIFEQVGVNAAVAVLDAVES